MVKKWTKKWTKKLRGLSLMLALLLGIMTGLAGCGSSDSPAESKEEKETTQEEADSEEKESKPEKLSIEEKVLVEWEGLKITATALEEDEYNHSPLLKLLVENDTSYGIRLDITKLFVNGCYKDLTSYGWELGEIPAGKKANEKVNLNVGSVDGFWEKAGVEEIGEVGIEFTVRDSGKDYYDDTSVIYTSDVVELQTSAYESMDAEAIAEGKELYNQNGIRIVAKELSAYARYDYNYALFLYVENMTDKDIIMQSYDVSVDGFVPEQQGGFEAWRVPAGKYSVDGLVIFCDENVPNEDALKDIKELEFGVKIYEEAGWNWGYDDTGLLADTGMLKYEQ